MSSSSSSSSSVSKEAVAKVYSRYCDVNSPHFVKALSFGVVTELRAQFESNKLTASSFVKAQQNGTRVWTTLSVSAPLCSASLKQHNTALNRLRCSVRVVAKAGFVCMSSAPCSVSAISLRVDNVLFEQVFPRLVNSPEFLKLKAELDEATTYKVKIDVKSTETFQESPTAKPYTCYVIVVTGQIDTWTLYRRYSELLELGALRGRRKTVRTL